MKVVDLFNQEEHIFTNREKRQKGLFDDYDGFVEKFKPKKTTDDCYTPPAVYDYVLQYVADHCDIDGMTVVRRSIRVVITRAWSIPIIAW